MHKALPIFALAPQAPFLLTPQLTAQFTATSGGNVGSSAINATSLQTTPAGTPTTGSLLFTVYSGGLQVGTFTLTAASNGGNGKAVFASTVTSNGITSDGVGLEFPDVGMSGAINVVNPNPEYTDGAPICFKLANNIGGATTLSIESMGANAKTLQLAGGLALASGDASTNDIVCAIYDTTGGVWNVASIYLR